MPEVEFLATVPEQFKEGIEDDHKRMLQRLDHEKYERGEAVKRVCDTSCLACSFCSWTPESLARGS